MLIFIWVLLLAPPSSGTTLRSSNLHSWRSNKLSQLRSVVRPPHSARDKQSTIKRFNDVIRTDSGTTLVALLRQAFYGAGIVIATSPPPIKVHRYYFLGHFALSWLEMFATSRNILSETNATIQELTTENKYGSQSQMLTYCMCCALCAMTPSRLDEAPLLLRDLVAFLESFALTLSLLGVNKNNFFFKLTDSKFIRNYADNIFSVISMPIEFVVLYRILSERAKDFFINRKGANMLSFAGTFYIAMQYCLQRTKYAQEKIAAILRPTVVRMMMRKRRVFPSRSFVTKAKKI